MREYFLCSPAEVENKLKTFVKIRTSDDGWTHYYKDETTNEEWELKRYHSEYQAGGTPVLKRLPEPTLEMLMDIAMTSKNTSDIIGASLELSDRERFKREYFRDDLLHRLLTVDLGDLSDFEKERVRLIIKESELSDPVNRRNIIGKTLFEIQADAAYYRTIADRATQILSDIRP